MVSFRYCAYFLRFPDGDGFDYWSGVFSRIGAVGVSEQFVASMSSVPATGHCRTRSSLRRCIPIFSGGTPMGGKNYRVGLLATGSLSRGGVVIEFSSSEEFVAATCTRKPSWVGFVQPACRG